MVIRLLGLTEEPGDPGRLGRPGHRDLPPPAAPASTRIGDFRPGSRRPSRLRRPRTGLAGRCASRGPTCADAAEEAVRASSPGGRIVSGARAGGRPVVAAPEERRDPCRPKACPRSPSRSPRPRSWLGALPLVGYFVAAEALVVFSTWAQTALDLYSRSRLLEHARTRGKTEQVEARLEHVGAYVLAVRLTRFLGSVLLVAGIAFLALGRHVRGEEAHPAAFPWAGVALTVGVTFVLSFLVNDILVRLLARHHPSRFLLAALPALEGLRRATAPLRWPIRTVAMALFRVELEEPEGSAREEVLETVEEGEREGSLTADEADMIESIIDLDRGTAVDVCTPRGEIAMVRETTRLDDAARFMIEHGHRRMPVYGRDRDDVLGIVYAFDLLAEVSRGHLARSVKEVMRPPFFVPEGKPLSALLAAMRTRRVSMAVVLNEYGGVSGVVTMADVLERIVGEIGDEHDREEPTLGRAEGRHPVRGGAHVDRGGEPRARGGAARGGGLRHRGRARLPPPGEGPPRRREADRGRDRAHGHRRRRADRAEGPGPRGPRPVGDRA